MTAPGASGAIYDVMYGFVPITTWEAQIINSPFYQRLRWIKQLGFASYIFPGADHNRFSHAIGVMHSMHRMIDALGIGVPEADLHNPKVQSKEARLHRILRIAALLHDVGAFPFSHSIEFAYLRHGNDSRRNRSKAKNLPNSHEHLGSFIIKNTRYKNGITAILEKYQIDPLEVSRTIKGESKYLIANQLMHSDLDADRMDYLMRDAHYTGLKYGEFDRDFILSNLSTYKTGKNKTGFGVKESAIHAVDDFLIARYSWYTQVVKSQDSAKFDIMSSHVAQAFLEKNLIHQFHDLLDMIENQDERFFWWNDMYFHTRAQEIRSSQILKDPMVSECLEMLLFRRAPKTLSHVDFGHHTLKGDGKNERKRLISRIQQRVKEVQSILKKHGSGREWILVDIPEKDVIFTRSVDQLRKMDKSANIYESRDPIKVVSKDGSPSLISEHDKSLMVHLSELRKFIPSVYANDEAYELLQQEGLI